MELTYTRMIDPPQSSDDVWSLTPNVVYSWVQTNPLAWQPVNTLPGALRVELIVHRPDNKQGTLSVVLSYVDGAVSLLRYVGEVHHDGSIRWARIATALPPEEIPLNLAAGISVVASHPALFWKNQFGEVTVVVSASKATPFIDTEVIATLPEGFRPKYTMIFPCVASDTRDTGFLYMDRLGAIQVSFGSKSEKNVIACFSFVAAP